jgi:hypothetical protein
MWNRTSPQFRLCAIGLALAVSGCASSGPQTGVGAPNTDNKPSTIPGWQVESVERGCRIVLTLRDGTSVAGKYRGLGDVPDAAYAARYARSREENRPNLLLPSLGPGLRVTFVSITASPFRFAPGGEAELDFLGVESRGLRVRHPGLKKVTNVEFARVARVVDSEGQALEGAVLQRLAATGKVPIVTEILVDTPQGKTRVPFESVNQIEVGAKEGAGVGKAIGIVVAAAFVVALVAVIARGSSKTPPPTTEPIKVCSPLISSYDGVRYIPDSDAFGGAMFRRAKRTDWDVLEHMREVGGTYRLKIQKGHAETEFVDELKLLAVDHPPDTRVLPDFSGTLHVFGAPQEPLRAVAFDGSDVTTLIAKRDERSWVSNPFGRDPDNKAEARDGITLEFARPAGTDSAKLALRLQNTPWGYYLRHQFLELLGSGLERWYARMDSAPEDYQAFEEARWREVALRIRVWDGARWRSAGFVWEVGSALPRDVAVSIDLGDVPGERLRLRVDSTVGLWTIDSINVDYSRGATVEVREIAPSKVTDQEGRDLTTSVSRADGKDYVMSGATAWAEAIFPAPPRRPGWDRSIVLKTTGYYKIHAEGKGEPQLALVQRLVNEPGAFGQHTLRLLNGYEQRFFAQMGSGGN